ncbi:glycosyltransferase [Sulfurimonas paralvinellae]|uniref:Glycosyltransferase n=1 Tax=Sulfurimonas paralvinellae TaxID=317658 RepID=A0A7M1BAP4_9BACT|nr:glycosyltransferase [Sulfurimonas paralvinellae]QOP45832.1 glycosyltransferase [Sulfurimonas paralvinellae]
MKKKLAILIYSLASGGAERQVSILLKELIDTFDITLVLMNDTVFYNIPENTKIIYLEKSSPCESGIKKLLKLPSLGWKYKKILQDNKIEISFSLMTRPNYINIFSKLFGSKVKTIISERSQFSLQYSYGNLQSYTNKKLVKLYNYADVIVTNSKGNAKDLDENFSITAKMKTIYNVVDIDKIDQLKNEDIELRKQKFTFITIGRLDSGKNHKLLINAIQNLDANLWIIGDGELRNDLQQHIDTLNLQTKVLLLGRQENPYKFLSKSDCFVFGSNHEGFPNVLLEALACRLPIISTDCKSGPREILAPDNNMDSCLMKDIECAQYGILTPVNNEQIMKKAMTLMLNDHNLLESYQKKAILRAKYFEVETMIRQYIEVLD